MGSGEEFEGVDDESLWQGALRNFDQGDFFETHEYLEELWRRSDGELSEFYQGLLQAAVALHHFIGGNIHGARLLVRQARAKLEPLPPQFHGIDLARFLKDWKAVMEPVLSRDAEPEPLDPSSAPKIHAAP